MQAEAAKAVVRRYLDTYNTDWERAIEEFVADAGLAEHGRQMQAAFPNYQLSAQDMIAEGDRVAVRFRVRGVHRGALAGIPPTGREVVTEGIIIYRVADGRIVEHWVQVDMAAVFEQLGPAPTTVPA